MHHLHRGLLLLLLAALLAACSESPTGRRQMLLFSDEFMDGKGVQSFAQIKAHSIPSRNEPVNRYISCVASHLTARQEGNWEVAVLYDDEQLNAFAVPGNKIGIYTGLLQAARNQHQLAAVVGHEIGHVLANHSNERLSSQFATQTSLQLLYELWGGGEQVEAPTEAVFAMLGLGASVGILLPFSRAHEAEADQIGLLLMAEAGFDPRESPKLWKNMAEASGNGTPISFLSTHPSHETRSQLLHQNMRKAIKRLDTARAKAPGPDCDMTRSLPAEPHEKRQTPAAKACCGRWQWW